METNDFIQHDGMWWRKVARRPQVGEMIYWEFSDYKIFQRTVLSDVPDRIKFDDETYARFSKWDEFGRVLEPLPDDIHVHEGAAYRKVARKAKVGEKVLYTDVISREVEVLEVARFEDHCTWLTDGSWIGDDEYVVLEPLSEDSPTDNPFASLAQLPREITLSDVYEVYAHGKRAMAQTEFEAEELRYKRDSRRLREALHNEDIGAADGYWTLVRSHHEKMTHWRKEIEKWDSEISRIGGR